MYIPMMKTRQEELRVAKKLNYCFSDKIIPLFEVLDEIYIKRIKVDEDGNKVMELKPGNKRKTPIFEEKNSDDIITLDKINQLINKSKVFIDYFRFDIDKYGKQVDISSMTLAYTLNNNPNMYIEKLKAISKYDNMIPVLSLKNKFVFPKRKTLEIIEDLQKKNESIAFRLEDQFYEDYKDIIENNLRKSDYLLYDINEQNLDSKIIELDEISDCKSKAKTIILNSPRRSIYANKEYENCSSTNLIDNAVVREYFSYKFDGFGDYGGLKDQLPPKNQGSNGMGAALAVLYNYEDNLFYSFCNSNTSLGLKGYSEVIKHVLNYERKLNPHNNCEAYIKINSMFLKKQYGNWATWNNITLTRYIHQMYLNT